WAAGSCRLGHCSKRLPRHLEHLVLGRVALADGNGAHQAGAVMPIAAGKLQSQLIDRVEMPEAGGAADEEGSIAGAEHRARRRRVSTARENRYGTGSSDVALECARVCRCQHRFEGMIGQLRGAPY